MKIAIMIVVFTGAANGLGAAITHRFCTNAGMVTGAGVGAPGDPSDLWYPAFDVNVNVMVDLYAAKAALSRPVGVATSPLLDTLGAGDGAARATAVSREIVSPETAVADVVVAGLAEERSLILPDPQVATFWAQQKADDPERWHAGFLPLSAVGTPR